MIKKIIDKGHLNFFHVPRTGKVDETEGNVDEKG
jgi:hypothetical protein